MRISAHSLVMGNVVNLRRLLKYLLSMPALVLLGIPLSLTAQVGTSGINGTVTDPNGAPVRGATVSVTSLTTGLERSTQTSDEGTYSVNALPPGTYHITAEASGFKKGLYEQLIIEVGMTRRVDFALEPGQIIETVNISSEAALDTTSAVVSTSIDNQLLQNIPKGRNITALMYLSLGVPSSNDPTRRQDSTLNVNGVSGLENKYTVDGGDITDVRSGGAATTPALGSVQSVQVVTGGFSADMGRTGGNVLNIAVKSGTNEFHGTSFFDFRDDSLQAMGPFGGISKPAFGRQRFGGSIGGPIKKNLAFFFVALERDRDNEITTSGRRDTAQRRIMQSFARMPFYWTALTTKFDVNPTKTDSISARYSLGAGNSVSPSASQGARLQEESNFESQTDRQHQLTSSWTHTFSSKLINLALLNFLTFRNESMPKTTAPQIVFPSINVGGNFRADQTTLQRRLQFKDDLSWTMNKHTIRLGGDYSHLSLPQPNNFNLYGSGIIFVSCDFAGEPGCPTSRQDSEIPVLFSLINRQTLTEGPSTFGARGEVPAIADNIFALYAQDEFRVTRDLTLNLGIRWDYDQDFIGRNQVNRARPGRRTRRKKDIQPRLGIVWRLGRLIIRGGYGTFFQQNLLETRQLELLANGVGLPIVRSFGGTLSDPFNGLNSFTPPDIFVTNNEMREYYAHSSSVAGELEITGNAILSADLVVQRGRRFPRRVEINRKEDGTTINSQFGSVLETQSIGKTSYDGLSIGLRRRWDTGPGLIRHYQLQGSYTLSRAIDEANGLFAFIAGVSDPANPALDRGPSSFDARHRFTFFSSFELPRGIIIAPTIRVHSSLPFEIIQNHDFSEGTATSFYRLPVLGRNAGNREVRTGADVNKAIDAFNANPAFVAAHAGPIAHVDPNIDLSLPYFSVDLRITKRFRFGEKPSLEVGVDAFNLFNHTNIVGLSAANSSGLQNNVESSGFGRPLGVTPGGMFGPNAPRAFEFLLKFQF